MDKINEIKQVIAEVEADVQAFYDKGNKAAGTRVRNAMQKLKGLAQDIRTEVSELKAKSE